MTFEEAKQLLVDFGRVEINITKEVYKRRRGATKFSRRAERKAITALLGALTGEKPSGEQVASVAETLERPANCDL